LVLGLGTLVFGLGLGACGTSNLELGT